MDTKKLYIRSQKTLLNWGLGVAIFFFIITVLTFTAKNKIVFNASLWISSVCYTAMFVLMLFNRIKINKNAALATLTTYLLFSTFSLVDMAIKTKHTYSTLLVAFPSSPLLATTIAYSVALVLLFGLNFLYYRVYKATQRIQILESSQD